MPRTKTLIVRSRRPRPAFIPAKYQRTSDSVYEHSRTTPVSKALLITAAIWFSGGALLFAAVKTGWTPQFNPPKQGVNSILLTASIATQEAEPIETATMPVAIIEATETLEPLGVGQLDAALLPVSVSGQRTPMGARVATESAEKTASSPVASRVFVRTETEPEPTLQSKPVQLERKRPTAEPTLVSRQSAAPSPRRRGVRSKAPRPLHNPQPVFPPALLAAGVEGRVTVKATVRGDGEVSRVTMFRGSGYPAFDQAALTAVARWRFDADPDVPADSTMRINVPLRFKIDRR